MIRSSGRHLLKHQTYKPPSSRLTLRVRGIPTPQPAELRSGLATTSCTLAPHTRIGRRRGRLRNRPRRISSARILHARRTPRNSAAQMPSVARTAQSQCFWETATVSPSSSILFWSMIRAHNGRYRCAMDRNPYSHGQKLSANPGRSSLDELTGQAGHRARSRSIVSTAPTPPKRTCRQRARA
jgi:hypothetical protein